MDNLIRARNCLPIIQLDYTQAQGMITLQSTASLSDAFTTTSPVANALTSMVGLQNTNQITINAVPVTASNEVYDAYLEFLAIPDSLITTPDPPPAGAAHICRNYCGMYYWIPVTCSGDFFRLALLTTAQRGQTLLPSDEFYAVMVTRYDPTSVVHKKQGGVLVTLELDQKIPNDSGFLKFVEDSTAPAAAGVGPPQDGPALGEPASKDIEVASDSKDPGEYLFEKYRDPKTKTWPGMTNRIRITYTGDVLDLESSLPKTAKIYLHHHQPRPPSTEDLLQRANFQLQQLNQNAVRAGRL